MGAPGVDGLSVRGTPLPVGDVVCPFGGARFTAAGGDTYACNGAPAASGRDDPDRIVTGYLASAPYTGLTVPCAYPFDGWPASCVLVEAGPLVITDLGISLENASSGLVYFIAGTDPLSPRWIRYYTLPVATFHDGENNLNLGLASGESLWVLKSHLVSGGNIIHWSGFR